MPNKQHNGWTNYETWVTKLWMDNDESSYRYYQGLTKETYNQAKADKTFTRMERAALTLGGQLKEEYEQKASELLGDVGIFSDLLGAALSEVNWREIAESLLEDIEEE